MTRQEFQTGETAAPRAVLFGVVLPDAGLSDDGLGELEGLAEAAGLNVVGKLTQRLPRRIPGTFLGKGKVDELGDLARGCQADVAIADMDLSPAQVRNLSKSLGKRVIDRSELIMDIFAGRARTAQSKLQVELAQLKYMLPRLRGQWAHLDRYKGGGVGTRGPGEKQLETDRRLVNRRIRDLEQRLAVYERRTMLNLSGRDGAHQVALAGYTNTGKSTLFNVLTGADVLAADMLFATLDTRTRKWSLPGCADVVISDTVGFVRDLPHHLVASFHATLEEVIEADLVLHVADASADHIDQRIESVRETLDEIGAGHVPVITVLNKIDLLGDAMEMQSLLNGHPGAVATSAQTGLGLQELSDRVAGILRGSTHTFRIDVPMAMGRVLARLGELVDVQQSEPVDDHMELVIRVADRMLPRLRSWIEAEGLKLERHGDLTGA